MKKIFGGINLTWKRLIISSIAIAIYVAVMMIIPITKDTSFRDIGTTLEWWILFGVLIIVNSKSPVDSMLKCFVFFLISQPLIYLLQVPFYDQGFKIFVYYPYWFKWTLATIPMGFIGYYIKRKDIISVLILLPALGLLAFQGIGFLSATLDSFPSHLLSTIFCFASIIFIAIGVFDKWLYRLITIGIIAVGSVGFLVYEGAFDKNFEQVYQLNQYDIKLTEKAEVTSFSGSTNGNAEIVSIEYNTVKLSGKGNNTYNFTIDDGNGNSYDFKYYYDSNTKEIKLELVK